jgi:ribosomal protein S18 acetylase RimI-like enzyme
VSREGGATWAAYVAFRRAAVFALARAQGLEPVDEPDLVGAVRSGDEPAGALLVTGPGVEPPLRALLATTSPEVVVVTEPALDLLPVVIEAGWSACAAHTAMLADDLAAVPAVPVPAPYLLQRVALDEETEGVSLEEALLIDVMYGGSAAAASVRDLPAEAERLRRLPGIHLFAALDPHGLPVATAGARVVGATAMLAAVATIPAARRRGLGRALSSAALRAAAEAGATQAFLDAATDGALYRPLGFTTLGIAMHCRRPMAG